MEKHSTSGITFTGALQIVFIVLKLLKLIDWSWFWVLSPMWISVIILAVLLGLMIWVNKE